MYIHVHCSCSLFIVPTVLLSSLMIFLKLFSLTRDNQKKRLRHREGTEPIVCLAPASPNYVSVFSSKGSIKTKEILIESNTLTIIVLLKPVTSPKLSGDHWNDQF